MYNICFRCYRPLGLRKKGKFRFRLLLSQHFLWRQILKLLSKSIIFIIVFFIATQLVLCLFPSRYIYNQRINYDVFKDNVYSLETTVKALKSTIKNDKSKDYIIFLGDSVGYGTPCPPDKTMSSYMNAIAREENSNIRVYNLGVPSTMFGDFYTIIKLLNKYGISTDNLILNFSYWEINAKTPTYWFNEYLKELDKESYNKMAEMHYIKKDSAWQIIKDNIYRFANNNIKIVGYSGFITDKIKTVSNRYLKQRNTALRVWSQKPELSNTMNNPANSWYFSDQAFDLSTDRPQMYFLNKIIETQKGKNTLFFLNAVNNALIPEATAKEGYKKNIAAIDNFFTNKGLNFVDYNTKVDYSYFSDHVHLLPEGYRFLAQDLWTRINFDMERKN